MSSPVKRIDLILEFFLIYCGIRTTVKTNRHQCKARSLSDKHSAPRWKEAGQEEGKYNFKQWDYFSLLGTKRYCVVKRPRWEIHEWWRDFSNKHARVSCLVALSHRGNVRLWGSGVVQEGLLLQPPSYAQKQKFEFETESRSILKSSRLRRHVLHCSCLARPCWAQWLSH